MSKITIDGKEYDETANHCEKCDAYIMDDVDLDNGSGLECPHCGTLERIEY